MCKKNCLVAQAASLYYPLQTHPAYSMQGRAFSEGHGSCCLSPGSSGELCTLRDNIRLSRSISSSRAGSGMLHRAMRRLKAASIGARHLCTLHSVGDEDDAVSRQQNSATQPHQTHCFAPMFLVSKEHAKCFFREGKRLFV
jgi:hypothetical protein